MGKEEFYAELREVLEVEELDEKADLTGYENWDSLGKLTLISFLGERYGVRASNEIFNKANTPLEIYQQMAG